MILVNRDKKILFWVTSSIAQRIQMQHPESPQFSTSTRTAAAATRHDLLARLAREDILIATPHTSIVPALGRLRREGVAYSWVSWYLPINGREAAKATITTLLTAGAK